jgi:hypothetical protein
MKWGTAIILSSASTKSRICPAGLCHRRRDLIDLSVAAPALVSCIRLEPFYRPPLNLDEMFAERVCRSAMIRQ